MLNVAINIYHNLRNTVYQLYHKLHLNRHENTKGRKLKISLVDSLTLVLFKAKQNIQTKRSLFEIIAPDCSYKTLVMSLNRVLKNLARLIGFFLAWNRTYAHLVKHTDATAIPVCLVKNAGNHKTMSAISSWSKTGTGWFYGLKLHLTSDLKGRVLALCFTSANANDRDVCLKMNEKLRGLFVVDAGYVSAKLERDFFIEKERMIRIIPRANMKKLATTLDVFLLNTRMKVEVNFRNLKLFYGLVTSLPRSIDGYLTNYLSAVLAYLIA
jgi:IS5 family transposase